MNTAQANFDAVIGTLGKTADSRSANIMSKISSPNFGSNISELVSLQVDTAMWTVSVGATQNLVKEISDAMKSVIQKS